jgi:hypothetical protein
MKPATVAQPNSQPMYARDGLQVRLHHCDDTPDHFKLEVLTPDSRYEYGDYPAAEAHELAQSLIDDRKAWCPADHGGCWLPTIWRVRDYHRGGKEFWRRGPEGAELSVHQPHGSYWRMYWRISPVVRNHQDQGIFDTPFEAMGALEALANNGMMDALLD